MDYLVTVLSYLPFFIVLAYILMDIFRENPEVHHSIWYKTRRAINWLPLGFTYAFLYMARYNLTVAQTALGSHMSKESFGTIFGIGAWVYALSFLINGPMTDKFGGKKAILVSACGAAIANIAMGVVVYGVLKSGWAINLTAVLSALYGLNMYFQSYGAVAIVKVNASWFHVRERGTFGGIFGILISLGLFFAFDWGATVVNATKAVIDTKLNWFQVILRSLLSVEGTSIDQTWWVFFVPAGILLFFAILDLLIIRDTPGEAGLQNIYTADASSGEDDKPFQLKEILVKILTNKILMIIAFIEFCTGVLRNGVMHWYKIYISEIMKAGDSPLLASYEGVLKFMNNNWGLLLMLAGVFGGMVAGTMSDRLFRSRRGPVAAILYGAMFFAAVLMALVVNGNQVLMAIAVIAMSFCVIGTHGVLSGTSTMDFGGRRAAGTAVGLIDGFVYLGTGFQSLSLGYITTHSWGWWPIFLIPFTLLGIYLASRIWHSIPVPKKAS
jgi:MFS transporter, OPA family, glycerol-3-phosphate transporter